MTENITITFEGVDEVSDVIQKIYDKLNDSPEEEKDKEDSNIEIIITSDEIEPEVEQVMWDLLDKIKTRATEEDAEYLLNL
jgi:hypothetical protein